MASAASAASAASGASGASDFLLGDDAVEFMQERGEQTWEAANETGGCEAVWLDDCAQCGDGGGLRACCGYCHLVFHPACLDLPQDVENWDEVAFACGLCVTDAVAKLASATQGARPVANSAATVVGCVRAAATATSSSTSRAWIRHRTSRSWRTRTRSRLLAGAA